MLKEKEIIMPNLIGVELFQASDLLNGIGMKLGKVTYQESKDNNIVINQSIKSGEIVNGRKVDITVSSKNPIRYLPSIYQINDLKNDNFLKRYLWIFQHIINSINIKLENIHKYFNPLESNSEFFHWLASWFSISLDYAIPEQKFRLLIKEAVKLYQWRGTSIGISAFIEIITGIKPDIIEHSVPYNEYIIMDNKLIERPILEENYSAYNFTVSFPVSADYFDIETIKLINQIIKSEKPAHTNYHITFSLKEQEKAKSYFTIGRDEIIY
ncbi:MAG: phage tail protein [Spirochaetota bacterium]|nr:phage tail protein [Spirochaetota bacterium]